MKYLEEADVRVHPPQENMASGDYRPETKHFVSKEFS